MIATATISGPVHMTWIRRVLNSLLLALSAPGI